MAHESLRHNPFMLMMNPEVVLAAVERSERLSRLNRHLCRPLDRQVLPSKTSEGGDGSSRIDGGDGRDDDRAFD